MDINKFYEEKFKKLEGKDQNIFLYVRDSLGRTEQMEKQETQIREFVESTFENPTITVYKDSGSVLKEREGFNNLLKDVKEKTPNWVVVLHIDRLYKATYENGMEKLNEIVDKILNNGTGIISVKERKVLNPLVEVQRGIKDMEEGKTKTSSEVKEIIDKK